MIGTFSLTSWAQREEVTIGTGTTPTNLAPIYTMYNYSLSEQIYTGEEIGMEGTIQSISFNYVNSTDKDFNVVVYMKNVDIDKFNSVNDYVSLQASDAVFTGVMHAKKGWVTITLDQPFEFDGTNLLIAISKNYLYWFSGDTWAYTSQNNTMLYYGDDNSALSLTSPSILHGGLSDRRPNLKLMIEESNVTCAKPKNFNATGINAHNATLTWTAGAEGQSNWDVYVTTNNTNDPGDNPSPIQQVTECTKALSDLEAQTTYYAFVRSACGGDNGNSKWAKTSFRTTRVALTVDATAPYSQNFETSNDWGFENGTLTNQWCWDGATNNGGAKSMYISNNNGQSNAYSNNSTTTVYASKLFNFAQGTYTFSFDWKANGENNCDYLRVALAPGDVEFTANTNAPNIPNTWIVLDGNNKLCLKDSWQTQTSEVSVSGTYTMVFLWRNDGSVGNNPPAAIDNISISYMTCPRPTALTASNVAGRTATLSWTENGTATNWVLQYATASDFTGAISVTVSGSASKELSGLSPETKYYARVKSVLGSDGSSWSDVKDFTTTATCVKPTNVTASNISAYEATIGWTNGEEGQNAWEISYGTSQQSNPENGSVIPVTDNPFTLTGLSPETSYYVYVRANCGGEDGKSAWSSYKNFTTLATCIKPTSLTASNITGTTATITWTAGEVGQNRWNLEYKKSTESTWQNAVVENNPTYSLDNLSPVTAYNVRVQADCGDDDRSQWAETTFTTGCGAISLPYTCDFEGTMQTVNGCKIPQCWSVIRGYYNQTYSYGIPTVAKQSSGSQPIAYPHGGTWCLYFLNSTYSGTGAEYAILPEISKRYKIKNVQIKFWGRSYNSSTVQVGVMTDPSNASTFVKVADVDLTSSYAVKTVTLETYTGKGRYIAFCCPAATQHSTAFYIDDITVEYIPSCQVPTDFEASVNSATEATLTWVPSGSEEQWEVEIATEEATDTYLVSEPTYTFATTGNTTYTVQVRAVCDEDDYSDWSNQIFFTTPCGIATVDAQNPFHEDFNSTAFPPGCWQKVNFGEMGVTNGWQVNMNNNLDDQGAVSSDFNGETWLFLPHMHIEGNATLSFDNLFSTGTSYCTSSIMVSTDAIDNLESIKEEGFIGEHFTQIWAADPTNLPSNKQNETVSLSNYNGQDVYIAFRYEGSYTTGQRTWWIDNVQVYVPVTQTVTLSQGWNWWSPTVETATLLSQLENGLGTNGVSIISKDESLTYDEFLGWIGNDLTIETGKMYKIQTTEDCSFTLTGQIVIPAIQVVTLNSGYNWIGFFGSQNINLEEALSDLQPEVGDVIMDKDHTSTYDETLGWIGNITSLEPGKGYLYKSNAIVVKTFHFPTSR